MATITEDYVSFEIAKLLVRKGFNFNAEYESYYTLKGVIVYFKDKTQDINIAPRITLQMAMKWLREEKNIIIVIQPEYFNAESICSAFGCDIWCNDNYEKLQGDFPSHEEAVEAALKYSLENLI